MSAVPERIVAPQPGEHDIAEAPIRPQSLAEFVGQQQLRDNLAVFIEAAKSRGEALDHVLFFGPPGLGKTTLAQIVSRELGVGFRATSGPVIQRAGDLAALLTSLQPRDILFIDEIHRLMPAVEEILYPAMEDFQLDLIIGEGRALARYASTCRRSPWSARRPVPASSPGRCASVSASRCAFSSTSRRSWRRSSPAAPAC